MEKIDNPRGVKFLTLTVYLTNFPVSQRNTEKRK